VQFTTAVKAAMNRKWVNRGVVLPATFVLASFLMLHAPVPAAEKVTVFAAASTTNAITDIGNLFMSQKPGAI
jgi:ABC-type molybdate transport system substrate-binding protein